MTTQVVVIAHGARQDVFDRHLKFWQHGPILVVTPENDPVKTDLQTLVFGKAQQAGDEARLRILLMLSRLMVTPATQYAIFEDDSICLSPKLPMICDSPGLYGNTFGNVERFVSPRYANPPLMMKRETLELIYAASKRYLNVTEEGHFDRLFAAWAFLSNVPILDYTPPGYSRATIIDKQFGEMAGAIIAGATMIHGIKYPHCLDLAKKAYEFSKSA